MSPHKPLSHLDISTFVFCWLSKLSLQRALLLTPSNLHLRYRRISAPMASSSDASDPPAVEKTESTSGVLLQYVVLRRDLIDSWPLGSVADRGSGGRLREQICTWTEETVAERGCSPDDGDGALVVIEECRWRMKVGKGAPVFFTNQCKPYIFFTKMPFSYVIICKKR